MKTSDIRADARKVKDEIDRLTNPRRMTAEEALKFYDILMADCESSEEAIRKDIEHGSA